MQVHGPNETVAQAYVGEYHAGAIAIYLGRYAITTYTTEDCDMLIAAACEAKRRHEGVLQGRVALPHIDEGVLDHLRAKLQGVALPDVDTAAEFSHIALDGTL